MAGTWDERLLSDEALGVNPSIGALSWKTRLDALFHRQRYEWPALARGLQELRHVRIREVRLGSSLFLLQHNPLRLASTSAVVEPEALRRRPCFLCPEALSPEQKGLAYRQYVILCNPYPILERHVTIVHREHRAQALEGQLEILLDLARDLAPEFLLLYNGPRCGASAPDHLHFQAAERARLPLWTNFARRQLLRRESGIAIFRTLAHPVPTLLYRATEPELLIRWFSETLSILKELTRTDDEPMLNLLVFAGDEHDLDSHVRRLVWTLLLFPRSRHRPSCFFAEEPARRLVSPAALDLAGIVVVPIREHFEKMTADELQGILSEVSLAPETFTRLVARLSGSG